MQALQEENAKLKAQIEKMKHCINCKHHAKKLEYGYHILVCKLKSYKEVYCTCDNWELKEN